MFVLPGCHTNLSPPNLTDMQVVAVYDRLARELGGYSKLTLGINTGVYLNLLVLRCVAAALQCPFLLRLPDGFGSSAAARQPNIGACCLE